MSPTVVGRAVKETPKVIKTNLKKRTFIDPPTYPQSCLGISNEFDSKWNFLYCFGAIANVDTGANCYQGYNRFA